MRKVTNFTNNQGWSLIAIPPGTASPMENHRGGEVAADISTKQFYIWEVFLITYGLDSVINACNKFPA